VDVQVFAGLDRRDHLADVDAVLLHGGAGFEIAQRDLVADRDVAHGAHLDHAVLFHHPAVQGRASLHAFDHHVEEPTHEYRVEAILRRARARWTGALRLEPFGVELLAG
jgi:hypothetical protein